MYLVVNDVNLNGSAYFAYGYGYGYNDDVKTGSSWMRRLKK